MKLHWARTLSTFVACAAASSFASAQQVRILGANDLGMHCMDKEYSVFSILPPFNVVNVQVVSDVSGQLPVLLDGTQVRVTYEAVADASGSFNSTSLANKTQFWTYAAALFGVTLPPGQGLTGLYMPADAPVPGPQDLTYEAGTQSFRAFGLPITPIDNAFHVNPFPLMRFVARDRASNAVLASLDVVTPVAEETDCQSCHATGQMAAQDPNITWSNDPDPEVQAKRNVLILHDARRKTNLLSRQPVLCASCHVSPPLLLGAPPPLGPRAGSASTGSKRGTVRSGPPPKYMSVVMHSFHGHLQDSSGNPVFPPNGTALQTCYKCHPGAVTQCLRGAMATGGLECLQCHGDMLSVGGDYPLQPGGSIDGHNDGYPRRPWMDVPRCQSCHTGDALSHLSGSEYVPSPDGIRLRQAYRIGDPAASAIQAVNQRFAENSGTQFRSSRGHGGLACEACHGSTHAEWPNANASANDNVAATELQGHDGPVIECSTCHVTLARTTSGPHGLHNVNSQSFVNDHEHLYEGNPAACQACHGVNLTGTVLSRAAADRDFTIEHGSVHIPKGTQVRCNMCHSMP